MPVVELPIRRRGPRIGPGPGSVAVELYAPPPTSARWDRATWDGGAWGAPTWQRVDCETVEAAYAFGVSDEAGILSVPDSGPCDLTTYDPDRTLDPSNADSPYFGYVGPGTPIRVRKIGATAHAAWTGFIDEAEYDVATGRGRIRCVDGIAYLAQAILPAGTVLPNTLRARVRAIVQAVGLATIVPVAPDDPTDPPPEVPVAAYDGQEQTAWAAILNAAQDGLVYVWLDPTGSLRFTSWGAFPDASISLGCGDVAEGPWIEGIETVGYIASAAAIRNQVRAWTATNVNTATVPDAASVAKYGGRLFAADRIVPDFSTWAGRILADRAGSGLSVALGTVRPQNEPELDALIGIAHAGPEIVRVRDDSHPPVIDQDVSVIGGRVRVTEVGWSFEYVTMIPRVEWESVDPTPPEPPIPPPDPWHTETRTYQATSDALLALTSGGAQYGAGASTSLPVGTWSGWTYRSLIKFASIPWTKVRAVKTATLHLRTTDQIRIGFGGSPTIELRRITGSWSAGSASSPSSGNAVVYPGPSTTSTGSVRANVTDNENTEVAIRVDAIVRAWAPSSAGGSGASQHGIALYPGSGSGSDTTEFYPEEQGSGPRPELTLSLEVFD